MKLGDAVLDSAILSDTGKVRQNNEDNCHADDALGLLMVADGMGGHAAGEVASQMAVDVVKQQVEFGLRSGQIASPAPAPIHLSDRGKLLWSAVALANEIVYASAQKNAEKRGMGTTVVVALASGSRVAVAHVGDSRLYLFRKGELRQITQDHSVVAEQVAQGLMTLEEAENSNIKNVLTRALGVRPEVEIDVTEHALQDGDILLGCTDGLSRMVDDKTIAEVLQRLSPPTDMCNNLVRLALERGGADNVTVAVARVQIPGFWSTVARWFGRLGKNGK